MVLLTFTDHETEVNNTNLWEWQSHTNIVEYAWSSFSKKKIWNGAQSEVY